ncbi:hypothetical protein WR25_09171 [Diploscapter pachys]|uniref:Secreted protein n=1 Tax=Diploscapter pachys TaxID=2018661 RepID=A0A2A2LWI7_9BILA|nr:hypothetical protein WR25_09171 [Diploscapter pachys]
MKLVVLLLLVGFASSWIIYRRNQKRKLLCREENEWGNSTLPLVPIEAVTGTSITESTTDMVEPEARKRRRRDVPIDPVRKEPIIFLGGVCHFERLIGKKTKWQLGVFSNAN